MASDDANATRDIRAWLAAHLASYLESGGTRGHILDFTAAGGQLLTPNLLLKTAGRSSGSPRIVALIYGILGGEAVIVASKGGAPDHPAWYLNLKARPEAEFQIATQAWRASWREPAGEERQRVWDYMVGLYPPYRDYQAKTQREIPLVMLRPLAETAVFRG